MTADTRIVPFPGPTEPRHATEDAAWHDAMRYLKSRPEFANVSAAVLMAYIEGAKNERRKLEAEHG